MSKRLMSVLVLVSGLAAVGCGRPQECLDLETACNACPQQCDKDICLGIAAKDDGTSCSIESIGPCTHLSCPVP